jgi:hypothetical protein
MEVNWTFTEAATYDFTWVTTGPGTGSTEYVTARKYIAVCPVAEAADWIGASVTDPAKMVKVRALLALATREAEKIVGPTIPRRIVDDFIPGTTRDVLRVPQPPLPDVNAVEQVKSIYGGQGGPVWTPDLFRVFPEAGTIYLLSQMPFWFGPWLVTYTPGRSAVSETIIGGVREIMRDLWATQRWVEGDADTPGALDEADYEARLPPGYAPPTQAMRLLAADAIPGFG